MKKRKRSPAKEKRGTTDEVFGRTQRKKMKNIFASEMFFLLLPRQGEVFSDSHLDDKRQKKPKRSRRLLHFLT